MNKYETLTLDILINGQNSLFLVKYRINLMER